MEEEEQDISSQNMHKVLYGNRDAKIITAIKNLTLEISMLTAAVRLGKQYVIYLCVFNATVQICALIYQVI